MKIFSAGGFRPCTTKEDEMSACTHKATVFFDIDGTLGWNDPTKQDAIPEWERGFSPAPSPRVADAIRRLVSRGNRAFLCSGRSPHDIHPDLAALPFSGMVALAGAYVRMGDEVLRDCPLPEDTLRRMDQLLREGGYGIMIESAADKVNVRGGTMGNLADTPQTIDEALEALADHKAYKLVIRTTAADMLMADPQLGKVLVASRLECDNSEIGLACNTKKAGIECVLARLGDDAGTTYGFGDSENDLTLFGEVDVSVAMGNAIPAVKQQADYVTDGVLEDGVATGLEHLALA